MAKIAFIQNLFPVINASNAKALSGFSKQVYEKFFEVLVEESGHEIWRAINLDDYQLAGHPLPDVIVCSPFAEVGNLAPGFAELKRIQMAYPDTPVVIWTSRDEASLKTTVLEEYQAAAFYTGTLLDAPDYFADLVLELT